MQQTAKIRGLAKIWREIKRPFRSSTVRPSVGGYNEEFQKLLLATSCQSAEQIVPYVMELVQPKSVVDVGCGVGAWLAAFRDLGNVKDHLGFDGDYIKEQLLLISPDRFVVKNLEEVPITCERSFDLAVSLEVAEHLSEEVASSFVKSLTQLAPVVLFSAAIPWQGGANHINEQWPSYWAELFAQFHYVPIDCIRRKFWNNEKVSFWYSQNAFLYVQSDRLEKYPLLNKEYHSNQKTPLSLIHPVLWKTKIGKS
jgi:SAM-dependent methyltransferase